MQITKHHRNKVARYLKTLRKKHKLTQMGLAELAGLNHGTISNVENGSALPGMATIMRIRQAIPEFDPVAELEGRK